jgi:predicted secreted protein
MARIVYANKSGVGTVELASTTYLHNADNGNTFSVQANGQLVVALVETLGDGNKWLLDKPLSEFFCMTDESKKGETPTTQEREFRFNVKGPGEAGLSFTYRNPYTKNGPVVDTFTATIQSC